MIPTRAAARASARAMQKSKCMNGVRVRPVAGPAASVRAPFLLAQTQMSTMDASVAAQAPAGGSVHAGGPSTRAWASTLPAPVHPVPSVTDQASLDVVMAQLTRAQEAFEAIDSQEAVDKIFAAAALAAANARLPLARAAVGETGLGRVEDKVLKNHFSSEIVFHKYERLRTVGIIEEDTAGGFQSYASPVGPVAAIIPVTNPTSTVIFKLLLALKTRNCVLICPHPKASGCSRAAAQLIYDAAVAAGAPEGCIAVVDTPSLDLINKVLHQKNVRMILATGGGAMVEACYSSGKPALGVGAGNTPAVIDEFADIERAVSSIQLSKSFDNGVICASEQSCIIVAPNTPEGDARYHAVLAEFKKRGSYLLNPQEADKVKNYVVKDDGHTIGAAVGQTAAKVAKLAGITVPENTPVLLAEATEVGPQEKLSREKLCPLLAVYRQPTFDDALHRASELVHFGGMGHTSCLYSGGNQSEVNRRVREFEKLLPTGRVLVDQPSSFGAIGDMYNFRLEPAMTLGGGSWGGSSLSGNLGPMKLLNIKSVALRRENMQWFRVPPRVYYKRGILRQAFEDLYIGGSRRAFLVTDMGIVKNGGATAVENALRTAGIAVEVFDNVKPDPTTTCISEGVARMKEFEPDLVIALGGGSPLDAAKAMRLMYEHPDVHIESMFSRFMDIRKRIFRFPMAGTKIPNLVAIPTTSGTGAEITPFVVVTDAATGRKYPIADYSLTPQMAIIDPDFVMGMPKGLTAMTGMDAVTHAVESYVSIMATPFTQGHSVQSLRMLFKHLRTAHADGSNAFAREQVHYGATLAAFSFANAFLGIAHSMAHMLGGNLHLPHGMACTITLPHVIAYNATDAPTKRAAFSSYGHYSATEQYAELADLLSLTKPGDSDRLKTARLVEALQLLMVDLSIPATVKDAVRNSVSYDQYAAMIPMMAEAAFDDQCTSTNPRYPLIVEMEGLFGNMWDKPVKML